VLSIFSDGEEEDLEKLDVLTDDIGMPILDENYPDLPSCFRGFFHFCYLGIVAIFISYVPELKKFSEYMYS
jgi:hypothetical protein